MFQECKCKYCKGAGLFPGFPALWILQNNKYWIEIPKNASKSIKDFTKVKETVDSFPNKDQQVFVVIRNPITRFKSLYNHYFVDGYRKTVGHKWASENKINLKDPYSLDTIQSILDNLDKLSSKEEVHHFYPQSFFIPDSITNLKKVPISEVSSIFGTPIKNESKERKIKLTSSQQDFISNLYESDLQYLE